MIIAAFVDLLVVGNGNSSEISMSKIRNRMDTMKNCVENGIRCVDICEKPHSNGDHFSFRVFVMFDVAFVPPNRAILNTLAVMILVVILIVSFSS
jgi:hypothetical protein